ncbi:hypothetical protein ACH4RG_23080 [Streptomyces sp. NPDC021019]|uniref:hypothetical protein n=1 Tax=Streptomyces sp. NPDC021019 TaxID=3365108 RepID=UPI0037B349AC
MDPDDIPMKFIPVKVLLVEAVGPDGTVQGQSVTASRSWPEEALAMTEESLMALVRQRYPGAVEYRSWGWKDTEIQVPEDEEPTGPDAAGQPQGS